MSEYSREELQAARKALYDIRSTTEAHAVETYLKNKRAQLADKALSCTEANLAEIQGKARFCEEMIKDLHRDPIVDTNKQ